MRAYFFILISVLLFLASCVKEKKYRDLPQIENGITTDSLNALRAWVEQVAIEKRDSIRKVDSIAAINKVVDTNSLFHKKNMMIAIVEVNDHFFPNVNCYLDRNGKPMFDLAFPFSANMNIDPATGQAYVSYNPQHQAMLRNGTYRKVQNAGIPVGLSLLGNHDAAGWSNFKNLAEATAFAQLVAIEVRKNGFAAVLSDDEYSDARAGAASNSYVMVMSEIKRLLPDIFLCYYIYGGGSGSYNGKQMGDIADALFGAFYPQYVTSVYNAPNSKMFPSTSETGGGFSDVAATVARAKADGLGGFMFYNVCGRTTSPAFYTPYLSALRGSALNVTPGCLNPNEFSFVNGQ